MASEEDALGSFIKNLRLKAGLNRPEFYALTGVAATYLNNIEGGQVTPSLPILVSIAKGLGIPVGILADVYATGSQGTNLLENGAVVLPPNFTVQDREEVERFIAFKQAEKLKLGLPEIIQATAAQRSANVASDRARRTKKQGAGMGKSKTRVRPEVIK